MVKKFTFLLSALMIMTTLVASPQYKAFRNQIDNKSTSVKPSFDRGGIIENTILKEDFSKFTAGNDVEPDYVRLDDADGYISDEYFNTPGWKGSEVYQAGGCAYIGFSEEYQETGIIITPLINTTGAIYIRCRVRTIDPKGDVIGYNIMSEDMDLLDANVDFFRATDEWTEISWFTSAGSENSRVWIFAYSKNIFIDDIEIVSLSVPTPTLLEETNIGSNNFTANWETVEDADAYIFRLVAQHTANAEETFYYSSTSFDNVSSYGTIEDPEIVGSMEATIENWYIFMPALINEAIGFTGRYASEDVFGAITSNVADMSSNNGKVNISFKALSNPNTELIVSLITSEYGYYDVADQKTFFIEKEGWNEYNIELENGYEDSYIEITSFSSSDIFFDDLKLFQTIKSGDTKTLVIEEVEVSDNHYKANINETYINDVLSYQVASRKNVYSSSNKIIGTIDSEFTELRTIALSEESQDDIVSFGDGEISSSYAPISNYGTTTHSLSQQIYTKEQITKEGAISSISFRNKTGNSNVRDLIIYMCNTKQESYRDGHDWVTISEDQIVFDDEVTFGNADEWTTIELPQPFMYDGNNLSISIYDVSNNPIGYGGGHDTFYATAVDTLRGLYKTATSKIDVYHIEEVFGFDLKTSVYSTPANQYYVNNIKFEFSNATVEYPSVPQNLSASVIDENSIHLSWTSAKNATSYNIYCGTKIVANVTTTSYLVEGLEDDTEYCFRIAAVNEYGESDKSEEACKRTPKDLGISELSAALNVYPNPVNDKLYIETAIEIEEVSIFDIYGRKLSLSISASQHLSISVDVSNLNAGVYFIKANTEDGEVVKRFIKN